MAHALLARGQAFTVVVSELKAFVEAGLHRCRYLAHYLRCMWLCRRWHSY